MVNNYYVLGPNISLIGHLLSVSSFCTETRCSNPVKKGDAKMHFFLSVSSHCGAVGTVSRLSAGR